jgi:hypothetical protein
VSDLLYVYALLDKRVAPPTPGGVRVGSERGQSRVRAGSERGLTLRQRRIEVIEVGGVFAAVERLSEPPAISEQALRDQHQIVVRLARTAGAILPVRFGTFVDRQELERVVDARQDVLVEAFRKVRGKAQMTLRVFGPPVRIATPQSSRSGTDYLRARAALRTPRLPKRARAIVEAVRPLVSAETIDPGHGPVRVTVNHLIDRKLAAQYVSVVEPLLRTSPAHGPRSTSRDPQVTVSGPWPPFAFVPDLLSAGMPLERLTP